MYAPKEEYRRLEREWPGVRCYRQVAHMTLVAENGAIEMRELVKQGGKVNETVVCEKEGRDGRKVTDFQPPTGT